MGEPDVIRVLQQAAGHEFVDMAQFEQAMREHPLRALPPQELTPLRERIHLNNARFFYRELRSGKTFESLSHTEEYEKALQLMFRFVQNAGSQKSGSVHFLAQDMAIGAGLQALDPHSPLEEIQRSLREIRQEGYRKCARNGLKLLLAGELGDFSSPQAIEREIRAACGKAQTSLADLMPGKTAMEAEHALAEAVTALTVHISSARTAQSERNDVSLDRARQLFRQLMKGDMDKHHGPGKYDVVGHYRSPHALVEDMRSALAASGEALSALCTPSHWEEIVREHPAYAKLNPENPVDMETLITVHVAQVQARREPSFFRNGRSPG